jgi:hypothetical protein
VSIGQRRTSIGSTLFTLDSYIHQPKWVSLASVLSRLVSVSLGRRGHVKDTGYRKQWNEKARRIVVTEWTVSTC